MMMQGDFDLNPVQIYTDSLKEFLKQTMLDQDVVFRNQVHELHRLYRVQESLMKDFGWKECNRYISWNPKAQSSLLTLANPTRYEPLANENRYSSTTKVDATPFISQELLKDCQGAYHKLQHRPLDLRLSADEFINHVEEDLPKRGNFHNCFDGLGDFKLPLSGSNSSDAEELKLSLNIGGNDRTTEGKMRTCFMKRTYSYTQNVIDLEESIERIPDGYSKWPPPHGCVILETHSKGKHESQGSAFSDPIISTSVKKNLSHEIAEISSIQERSECCQEETFSSADLGGQLDLNKVHLDDSSCCSDDHMLAYPSTSSGGSSDGLTGSTQDGSCPSTFQKNEATECLNEPSDLLKQDNVVNLAFVDFNSKNKSTDVWTINNEIISSLESESLVGPESMLSPTVGISEELCCCSGDHKNDSVVLRPKLAREVSCEKSEVENAIFSCTDQSQNTLIDENGNKSPASCKSYCISDNDSSSAKTKHSSITSHLGSQVADVLTGMHDQRTSDSSELKNGCCKKKEESAEVDVLIQQAAELLIHISSEHSACCQDSSTEVGSKEMEDCKRERPQCSLDSFELITLNLEESNMDDHSVSSKPFEVNDLELKDFGLKLRRGRRMKDFQREILPSLASLSRHEILEDINIMEGVLRSREYRKFRAKMATQGENWSAPVRSRRSRLSYAGRRIFS
ncbi:hypothetical protein P3X46_016556 [Hevea brasiliensis]|uniref:Uncharacterized protein n=1 Tax=Hevea brasiliensis TaxID=3981 RepID=A0ABQ9M0R9_HEVBR|nr:uncharacterized protein LOC110660396 [Hevea brasiliensis]XP_021674394.2 uncharacterized protein LOC110660396 [Hevea brasiliensis]XP_021674396.2 uncharacterized protein LOC110660396 [Hevea brasiliensis]XP_021674397.2 uncharacterized protein LOC110660396 [Hevea brasiliensis]XP_058009549.1 uncharacterized protein LOC110660396 [Hevea brasiliensis]KAJ9173418.1 hypothetical protein P3X46_016556 [Hevea brasiliensis]KAJ9173419.1 hypothetical protein P3X46_016556 [Hevea brasiliensis]KAJ9173420.1 h